MIKEQKHSEESNRKNRLAHLGKKHSEESKRKISETMKKRRATVLPPWNVGIPSHRRGKTYIDEYGKDRAEEVCNKISISCKDLRTGYHHSKETKIKIGKSHIGKVVSIETRIKISNSHKGMKKPWAGAKFGHKVSDETRKRISTSYKKVRKNWIVPKKDTSIEVKIQGFLKELGIYFLPHKYINIPDGYQCDVFIPSMNLVIECDGDYWHGNPNKFTANELSKRILKQKVRDAIRTQQLIDDGYKIIRLWESEINVMKLDDFKRIIS